MKDLLNWAAAIFLSLSFLILLGFINERDERIEELTRYENAASTCIPLARGEETVARRGKDGSITCTVRGTHRGKEVTLNQYRYM